MASEQQRERQDMDSVAVEVPDAERPDAEVPLCTHCVRPVPPFATRCPNCDEPIGSSTMLPFESIHAEFTFIARAARALSSHWRWLFVLFVLLALAALLLET